jgi:putative hydrolase of the HAD superfamily
VLSGLILDFGGVLTDPGANENVNENTDGRPLFTAVARAKKHGLRTGLLSNAEGLEADTLQQELGDYFDAVVLSGQAGFAKPDLRIYLLTAERLGLTPEQCVFVDDLPTNVHGAVRAGMVGVHHQDVDTTLDELTALFDLSFR